MKKLISLISILILISLSACSDGDAGSIGPNGSSNHGVYMHSVHGAGCEEHYYNDPDHWLPSDREYGKCPEEYSIHCAKRSNGDNGDYVQTKYIDSWSPVKSLPDEINEKTHISGMEAICENWGGLDDGEIH